MAMWEVFTALVGGMWSAILDVWWLWVVNACLLIMHMYRRRLARHR